MTSGFDWRRVRTQSRREGTSKNGPYRLHRWWARRPPTLVREMLRHAHSRLPGSDKSKIGMPLEGLRVLDPFVGGGSVALEAARLGARVDAFDIRPLAIRMLSVTLGEAATPADWRQIRRTFTKVEKLTDALYPRSGQWRPLHYFWVDRVRCGQCRRAFDAHPSALLAAHPLIQEMVAICLGCSRIHAIERGRRSFACTCGRTNRIASGNSSGGRYVCPHCRHVEVIRDYVKRTGSGAQRRLVAKEQVDYEGSRRFRATTRRDRAAFALATRSLSRRRSALRIGTGKIPTEVGDSRPQAYGIQTFDQLFNDRQLLVHGLIFKAIAALPTKSRNIAALIASEALATNCTMNAYASGYGRASAAFSIHGYMYVARPVELNPWIAGSGRGTIWNCLRKAQSALASNSTGHEVHSLHLGSLDALQGRVSKFDIICTDPPYYDNVAYERLAAFYETWLRRVPLPSSIVRCGGEPLPMKGDGFSDGLGRVFGRAAKGLRRDGVLIFTYAHSSQAGWDALEKSLRTAQLRVVAVYPAEAEGRNGFHRYKGSLKWNAVIVCSRTTAPRLFTAETRAAMGTVRMSSADKSNLARAMRAAHRVNDSQRRDR